MQSKATTVFEYLNELPKDRKIQIEKVRKVILANLPKGCKEGMQYGMIGYFIPLKLYPKGYLNNNKTPLPYAALASQKNYMSVYLMNIYGYGKIAQEWFEKEYKQSGKKLDMGRSCVRFKTLEDLPLDLIGKAIAKTSIEEFIQIYEKSRIKK
jgi:hypothetical protein